MSNSWKRRVAVGAASAALAGGLALTGANVALAETPLSVSDVCDGPIGCQVGPFSTESACLSEQHTYVRYYAILMKCTEVDNDVWKFAYKNRGT